MWIGTQTWQDVLFLHWPIAPKILVKYIPQELKLDIYKGNAWLSVVLFKVKGQRLRFLPPLPGISSYLQLNVRTYVEYNGRKGIYFFHLDITNQLLVKLATMGSLPYRYTEIFLQQGLYTSRYKTFNERLRVIYKPADNTNLVFDQWLVERYHSWAKWGNALFRIDIQHAPWQLQQAYATIQSNTLAPFLKNTFQHTQPIAHYAKQQVAKVFLPVIEHT